MVDIKLYSDFSCPYCEALENFLIENDIPFDVIDIKNDLEARREIFLKTKQDLVPILDINGYIIVGFEKEIIKKVLNIK
ncbi:MAG: glutaredoxin domain-containing protein [Candidatus Paceibacterota bacterium]|nr:glutaredoxin domain-containing protein [Candidatus Paceibacterota bacterium]